MSNCGCCLGYGDKIIVGTAAINRHVISVSLDVNLEVIEEVCGFGNTINLYGPKKINFQFTAYPFNDPQRYTLGLVCPVEANVQLSWKYILDCNTNGKPIWRALLLKKKSISATGDVPYMQLINSISSSVKVSAQAGPTSIVPPRTTTMYSKAIYSGLPIGFDTSTDRGVTKSLNLSSSCIGGISFTTDAARLVNFSFSFSPPAPPTVSYSFEVTECFK